MVGHPIYLELQKYPLGIFGNSVLSYHRLSGIFGMFEMLLVGLCT